VELHRQVCENMTFLLVALELKHADGRPDHPSVCHLFARKINKADRVKT